MERDGWFRVWSDVTLRSVFAVYRRKREPKAISLSKRQHKKPAEGIPAQQRRSGAFFYAGMSDGAALAGSLNAKLNHSFKACRLAGSFSSRIKR